MTLKEDEGVLKATDNVLTVLILSVLILIMGILLLLRFNFKLSLTAIILIICGLGCLLIWKKKYLYINKKERIIYSGSKGLFVKIEHKIPTCDVSFVEYNEYFDDNHLENSLNVKFIDEKEGKSSKNIYDKHTRIFLVLKSGIYVPVSYGPNTKNNMIKKMETTTHVDLARYIATYLGVKLVERARPTIDELVDGIKDENSNT